MNKKRIIIGVGLILCLCILMIFPIMKHINISKNMESIDGKTENNQLLLNGLGVFSERYTGYLKTKQIIEKLSLITKEELPKLYKEIKRYDDNKLENYYKENSTNIKENFGKKDFEEFKEFAKKIQNISIDLNNWYSIDVDKNSVVDKSDKTPYAYAEYKVNFENDESLNFSIYIAHKEYTKPAFIIDIK